MPYTRRIIGQGLALAFLTALAQPTAAQSFLDEETKQLLVTAVEAATELDLYNTRCRRDDSGRRKNNLNKELVSSFRMTILDVQDDLFPERSYRRARERLLLGFQRKLKEAGGCKEAKKAGMQQRLRARYDEQMGELEALP